MKVFGFNIFGQITGYAWDTEGNSCAFLYSAGKMTDLNTLIDSSLGWVLNRGNGINDLGQIIGSGVINGQTHPFLMTPVY
ncbi:MAG: hypothetical protein ACLQDI_22265 [Syntrophobacteraceae bacterium]